VSNQVPPNQYVLENLNVFEYLFGQEIGCSIRMDQSLLRLDISPKERKKRLKSSKRKSRSKDKVAQTSREPRSKKDPNTKSISFADISTKPIGPNSSKSVPFVLYNARTEKSHSESAEELNRQDSLKSQELN